jgi:hypothetical protein
MVRNTKTNERKICRVLRLTDSEKYGPIRSGKLCVRGEEYFKIFIDGVVHKMNNSLKNVKSLSEDGNWEFTGEKPQHVPKQKILKAVVEKIPVVKIALKPKQDHIEFISEPALMKIIGE